MRAYVLESFDSPPKIIDLPEPAVGDDEVLVRVRASSVNPHDAQVVSGGAKRYMEYRFPVTIGSDLAGVVEKVGPNVSEFEPGDRVFGVLRELVAHRGTFAEYVAVPEGHGFIVHQPSGLDEVEAGSLGLAALTALWCLDAVGVSDGDAVLINGATGGVGSCAVQITAAAGARVIATARPGEEERYVRELGAAATDKLGGITATNILASAEPALLRRIAGLVEAGKLRPPATQVYEFEQIDDAFAALAAGARGKIAVRITR